MVVVPRMVKRAEDLGVLYASDDWAPLSDITLGLLLKRAGIQCRYVPDLGITEAVWPPVCGVHVMHLDRAQSPGERRLAVRHGLGHVLADHVADVIFSHDGHDPMGLEETIADHFALVDLISNRQLGDLRKARYTREEMERWSMCEIRRYAPRWSSDRVLDRAYLRVQAFLIPSPREV